MKNILIFGGNGFLGKHLVPRLRARGHKVRAPRSREIDLLQPVPADTLDPPEVVIHAAALYGGMPFDLAHQARILATNTQMNLHAFEFCRSAGVKTLVTIGSACAYPGRVDHHLHENEFMYGPPHETVSSHAFTKLWMIEAHKAYRASYGLNGVHIVPANLYGPGDVYQLDRAHVVAALIKKFTDAAATRSDVHLMGDGSPVRELLYIGDLAELIVRAVERVTHEDLPINAGTGVGHTIRQLAEMIAEAVGFSGRTIWDASQPNGALFKVLDVTRMQRILGPFEPTPLKAGLHNTLEWYLEHKVEADQRT